MHKIRKFDGKTFNLVGHSRTRALAKKRTKFLKHPRGFYKFYVRIIKTKDKGYAIYVRKEKK